MKNEDLSKNNVAVLVGEVLENFKFDHETKGESFFRTMVRSYRMSDKYDDIVVIVSDKLVDVDTDPTGAYVKVDGQFRSYNKHSEGKSKVCLFLFAKEINQLDALAEEDVHNRTELIGTICKKPSLRKTPLGTQICDLLIAVNRPYGCSDYIPSIAWNKTAVDMSHLDIGDKIRTEGRLQSREYNKTLENKTVETRVAYEYSIREYEFLEMAESDEKGA